MQAVSAALCFACNGGAADDDGAAASTAGDGPESTASDSTGPPAGETTSATSTATAGSPSGGPTTGSTGGGTDGASTDSSTGGPGPQEVDVSRYEAIGPVEQLPAPIGNASGVAWNDDTERLWIVRNGSAVLVEYADDDLSTPIRALRLGGINGNDTEGLVYLGGGEVAIAFEGGYGVYIADVPDGDVDIDVPVKQTLTLAPPPAVGNNGLEGIAYDRDRAVFYAVGEGQDGAAPRRLFRFERPAATTGELSWEDPELEVTEPFDADAVLPGDGGSLDLAGITFDRRDGNVLIVSHTGSVVFQLDPQADGTILGELALPPAQWEGVTLVGPGSDLLVIGEPNIAQRYTYAAVR